MQIRHLHQSDNEKQIHIDRTHTHHFADQRIIARNNCQDMNFMSFDHVLFVSNFEFTQK